MGPLAFPLSHDYPEYETPSKQYENGPITYFEVITGLQRPYNITLANPNQPHMQKNGKFGKSRFHQLGNESKMRLLKTHSHNSERLGYEARENAKKGS